MLFASWRHYGTAEFLRAYNALPIPLADRPGTIARLVDISPRTVADWISGRHSARHYSVQVFLAEMATPRPVGCPSPTGDKRDNAYRLIFITE